MAEHTSEQELFEGYLKLVGKSVAVGLRSTGEQLRGRISNTMFDSFLLQLSNTSRVIGFRDVLYVEPLPIEKK